MRKLCVCMLAVISAYILPVAVWSMDLDIDAGSVAGAGVMIIENPYKGADDDVYPVPVLCLESRQFFIDSTVMGYYFNVNTDPVRWAVIGSLRSQGYEAGDSSDLSGMQDRDWAFDSGLRLSWKNKIMDMVLEGVTDVTSVHEGQEFRLIVSRKLLEGFLTPKAAVRWQSGKLVDYYYGVRPQEVRAGRAVHKAHADMEYMLGVTMGLPLGEKWALFGDVECTFLGDEARDSPIVGDDTLMRYAAGVVYRF